MTDPVLIAIVAVVGAFVAGLPATIAAIASLRQGQKNAVDTGALKEDVKVIHALTNSTNSNLTKALAVATERLSGLEKLLAAALEREKVDLARQAVPVVAQAIIPPGQPATNGGDLVDAQGDRIEKTTTETGKDVKGVKGTVQKVETQLSGRVGEVEAKLDEKKDK